MSTPRRLVALVAALILLAPLTADDQALVDGLSARAIGPANMGGRIVDLAVVESDPNTFYVAAATGGLWKTTDNGRSWVPVFDRQKTLSLGAVAVAPSDPKVLYVGTGEANPRNSVSWGEGVYRSTDAGLTWQHVGLSETHHIGRIVVHPTDPRVAYVAALGRLWGPGKERGVYKTIDGGQTWRHALAIDQDTGAVDIALDPTSPDTAYAAAWAVRRDAFAGGNPKWGTGPRGGLYKSADGGKTWAKLTTGLPDRAYGRCGLAVWRKDPAVVWAVIQTDLTSTSVRGQEPKEGTNVALGGLFRSDDRGKTWKKVNDLCPRPFYYGQIRLDPENPNRLYVLGVSLHVSEDGGKTFPNFLMGRGTHPDHHALWVNPKDPRHLILGNDGGLYTSNDQARSWEAIRNLPLGQFYSVAVDMRRPYRVYGGLQDNGSWGGPSQTQRTDGITLADWRRVSGGDGFACQVDPKDANIVYTESQYGRPQRLDLSTGKSRSIRPPSIAKLPAYRFNWNSPMLLSPHDSRTIYFGGNVLFRSTSRGDRWDVISPDLTRGQPGPSASTGHTITTIAESPLRAGLLYVGTDDGRLHVSLDAGLTWTERSEKVPGVPGERWISRVECSGFDEKTAYLAIDRHRNDDRRSYLFRTTDLGATWTSVAGNLPAGGPMHVVRESSRNPELLFAGTEFGLFASLDAGKSWCRVRAGLPTGVSVHDLVIHPRDRELVVGTHGRSVFVIDIAPLEELTAARRAAALHVCDIKPQLLFTPAEPEKAAAPRSFVAPNPPRGTTIWYHLGSAVTEVTVTVTDVAGKPMTSLPGGRGTGLQRVLWEARPGLKAGVYKVSVKAGDHVATRSVKVETE